MGRGFNLIKKKTENRDTQLRAFSEKCEPDGNITR